MKEKVVSFLSLFGSSGTLLCCAIPATLATLAGGAAISAYISSFPFVVPMSRHKGWIFLIAGALIAINGILTFKPQGRLACSITGGPGCDTRGQGCEVAGRFTKTMFWLALGIYAVGALTTYGLVPLLRLLEG